MSCRLGPQSSLFWPLGTNPQCTTHRWTIKTIQLQSDAESDKGVRRRQDSGRCLLFYLYTICCNLPRWTGYRVTSLCTQMTYTSGPHLRAWQNFLISCTSWAWFLPHWFPWTCTLIRANQWQFWKCVDCRAEPSDLDLCGETQLARAWKLRFLDKKGCWSLFTNPQSIWEWSYRMAILKTAACDIDWLLCMLVFADCNGGSLASIVSALHSVSNFGKRVSIPFFVMASWPLEWLHMEYKRRWHKWPSCCARSYMTMLFWPTEPTLLHWQTRTLPRRRGWCMSPRWACWGPCNCARTYCLNMIWHIRLTGIIFQHFCNFLSVCRPLHPWNHLPSSWRPTGTRRCSNVPYVIFAVRMLVPTEDIAPQRMPNPCCEPDSQTCLHMQLMGYPNVKHAIKFSPHGACLLFTLNAAVRRLSLAHHLALLTLVDLALTWALSTTLRELCSTPVMLLPGVWGSSQLLNCTTCALSHLVIRSFTLCRSGTGTRLPPCRPHAAIWPHIAWSVTFSSLDVRNFTSIFDCSIQSCGNLLHKKRFSSRTYTVRTAHVLVVVHCSALIHAAPGHRLRFCWWMVLV